MENLAINNVFFHSVIVSWFHRPACKADTGPWIGGSDRAVGLFGHTVHVEPFDQNFVLSHIFAEIASLFTKLDTYALSLSRCPGSSNFVISCQNVCEILGRKLCFWNGMGFEISLWSCVCEPPLLHLFLLCHSAHTLMALPIWKIGPLEACFCNQQQAQTAGVELFCVYWPQNSENDNCYLLGSCFRQVMHICELAARMWVIYSLSWLVLLSHWLNNFPENYMNYIIWSVFEVQCGGLESGNLVLKQMFRYARSTRWIVATIRMSLVPREAKDLSGVISKWAWL